MAAGAARTAARLTWAVVPGFDFDEGAERAVSRGFGGYVLGTPNLDHPEQIRRLTAAIRAASPVPVRLGVDQEGGHVYRVGPPLTRFPAAMAIGATRSPDLAYAAARATGRELSVLGIDTILAPVLDVALEPRSAVVGVRSYGSDPTHVALLGGAAVRGYLEGGVIPIGKHFPGHGGTAADTHLGLAHDRSAADLLDTVHLAPFRAAIAAGAPALMTSHVTYDGLGDGLPASLSRAAIGLARDRLAFDGLIVTDALEMDAVLFDRVPGESAIRSLESGVDVVMAVHYAVATSGALASALRSGRLGGEEIAPALARVRALDRLAQRLSRRSTSRPAPGDGARQEEEHGSLAREIARRSLTLVANDAMLPLDPATGALLVELISRRASPVEERNAGDGHLAAAVARRLPRLVGLRIRHDDRRATRVALEAAARAPVTILATRDAYLGPEERSLLASLDALGVPLVVIALRSPIDLTLTPRARVAIAAYTDVPATCDALADALVAGSSAFLGHLPISLSMDDQEAAA